MTICLTTPNGSIVLTFVLEIVFDFLPFLSLSFFFHTRLSIYLSDFVINFKKPQLFDLEQNKREKEIKRGIKPAQSFEYKPINLTSSGLLN